MKLQIAINENGNRIGEDHPSAKLTNDDVDRVFDLADEGMTSAQIAKIMDCSLDLIKKIRCGQRRCQTPAAFKTIEPTK
jgi:hypothetical protein